VACEGGVTGACAYAREKTTDCRAKTSRFGVSFRVEPRNPIRSARVVSSVIKIMFGDFGGEEAAGDSASAPVTSAATNSSQRITTMAILSLLRCRAIAVWSSVRRTGEGGCATAPKRSASDLSFIASASRPKL